MMRRRTLPRLAPRALQPLARRASQPLAPRAPQPLAARASQPLAPRALRALASRVLRPLSLLVLSLTLSGCGYNRIQELDERTDELSANVQAELVRRNDLIPNLVATVEEAARFEEETFTEVARARAGLSDAREQMASALEGETSGEELSAASQAVSENLRLFLNVSVEAYPQLTANQSFIRLQDELAETENRIAVSRRDYNEGVRTYNSYIRQFPAVITAKVIGAERKEPYEAPAGAEQAPEVDFGRDGG